MLEQAQSLIRAAVKDEYFLRSGKVGLDKRFFEILNQALSRLEIAELRDAARRSLVQFYNRQRLTVGLIPPSGLFIYLSIEKLISGDGVAGDSANPYVAGISKSKALEAVESYFNEHDADFNNYAIPLQKWQEAYWRENIKPVMERMAREEALDPDSERYYKRRSTLRKRAEREVRHQAHVDSLNGLRASGTRLVIISSHANCSERCRPFQGRVFSLDGTSGKTPDGRSYEPIENATNVLTPNGKWYNGLFGFGCRHYAVEYKDGYEFPQVSAAEERRQYAIDVKQRAFERKIREWRERAEMYKGTNKKAYRDARTKVRDWNTRYQNFSASHDRAYYPSRTKIF